MKKLAFYLSAFVLTAVLATGCAKVPQSEVDAAKASLDSASSVGANLYLAPEFSALQDSLNAANVAIESEKSKSSFSRNYKPIAAKLVQISSDGKALIAKAEERKAQVRAEVQDTLTALSALIVEDRDLLAKAPKGKEGKAALEAIQTDITVIEASVSEINTLVANGDYLTAQDKVSASKAKADAIKTELSTAIAKTKKR